MMGDGLGANDQLGCDFCIGLAFGEEPQYFYLTLGETVGIDRAR